MSSYPSSSSSPCRRETRRKTSSLPLDLLRIVLYRLPTILLLRLRSVCKEWRDIIDDPQFATIHTMSGVESPRILLRSAPNGGMEPQFAMDDEFLVTSLPKSVVCSWLYGAGASCHGLICFEHLGNGATYLLNPLTREIVSLSGTDPSRARRRTHWIAMGVDPLTCRYKILRVSFPTAKDGADRMKWAEVLEQGSRSWREIESVPPSTLIGKPVVSAGSIHWIVSGEGCRITSFDIAKEEFTMTPSPVLQGAHLVDLRGALGLVDRSRRESLDVWVMKESGRWVKEYRIPLTPPGRVRSHRDSGVMGCAGRKMVINYVKKSLLCYDPATDEVEYVQRAGASPNRLVCNITPSLLSPAKLWSRQ